MHLMDIVVKSIGRVDLKWWVFTKMLSGCD